MKKYFVLFFTLALIFIVLLAILIKINFDNTYSMSDDKVDPIYYIEHNPVSYVNINSYPYVNNNEIKLLIPSLGKIRSESKYITFKTESEFNATYITKGTVLLNKDDINIVILLAPEGNPFGLLDTKIESKDVTNSQFPNLKRYDISNIDALNESFTYLNISNNYMYIYTDGINSGLDCGEQYSTYICGSEYLYFTKGYEKYPIQLMCSTKNEEDRLYCDEFVKALEFNIL